MTQKDQLHKIMRRRWVTGLDALKLAGCLSLSQRCGELRRAGVNVVSRWVHVGRSGLRPTNRQRLLSVAGGMDWFRWHHGSVTDPKFQLVARQAGASLPDVLAVWAYLLETASAAVERGNIGEIDCEAVDCMFGFPATGDANC